MSVKEGFEPVGGEIVIRKHANSGFVGTSLDREFRTVIDHEQTLSLLGGDNENIVRTTQ